MLLSLPSQVLCLPAGRLLEFHCCCLLSILSFLTCPVDGVPLFHQLDFSQLAFSTHRSRSCRPSAPGFPMMCPLLWEERLQSDAFRESLRAGDSSVDTELPCKHKLGPQHLHKKAKRGCAHAPVTPECWQGGRRQQDPWESPVSQALHSVRVCLKTKA